MMVGNGRARRIQVAICLAAISIGASAFAGARDKPLPDLVVKAVSNPPASVKVGDAFSVTDTTANKGKKRAPATRTGYLLSTDGKRSDADVKLTATRRARALKPDAKTAGTADLAVPSGTPPGSYFVIACADTGEDVEESSDRNNCRASNAPTSLAGASSTTPPPTDPDPPPDTTAPAAPTLSGTDPTSPSSVNNPKLKGLAEAGAQISIFTAADCLAAVATGTAAELEGAGITVPVPADATTSLRATATDAAGNVSPCSSPFAYTEDSTPPGTQIDSGPAGPTNDSTPTFTFSSPDGGSSFQCRVDSDPFASCTSAHTTASLTDGAHTLEVKATDAAGNTDASPASRSFAIDTGAPQTTIDSGPAGPTNDSTPTFTFSSPDGGSSFQCRVDSDPFASCTSAHTTASLTDGAHTLEVKATDAAGNTDASPASRSFAVDTQAPTAPSITDTDPDSPANDNNPEVKGTGAEAGSTVRIYGDATCTDTVLGNGSAADFNGATGITAAVAGDQTTDLRATATDAAGNASPCPSPFAYTEDSTPPVAPSITDTDPNSPANDNNPEIKGTAEAGSTVRLYTTSDCSAAIAASGTASAFSSPGLTVTVAASSSTTFRATATDAAGNLSPCSSGLTYVEIAPVDADGDGFSPPADCNDTNAAINPGAFDPPGVNDGIDQDCDGNTVG